MTNSLHVQNALRRTVIYLILIVFGLLVLFPFLFMFFTSLKLPTNVFTSPPRLLPRVAVTTTVPGYEDPLPLYNITDNAGNNVEYALTSDTVNVSTFADPNDLGTTFDLPKNDATAVGGFTNQQKVTVDGEEQPLWEVTVNDETRQVVEVGRTVLGTFVDPTNPENSVLRNVRTSDPVQELSLRWANYNQVLELQNLDRSLTNTLLVTILVVTGQVVTSVFGGYAFARLQFPGRDSLFLVYLGTIMIPFVMLVIPMYQLMVMVGWVNRIAALVLPWIFTAYGTFLMRQFFLTIPKELEEAALIDGASRLRILWTLFVPMSMPAIATLSTFSFLYAWNSFFWPYVVINAGNVENHVLTLSLMVLQGRAAESPNLVMAGATIAVALPMIIFVLAQRFFVESVATSGLKG